LAQGASWLVFMAGCKGDLMGLDPPVFGLQSRTLWRDGQPDSDLGETAGRLTPDRLRLLGRIRIQAA